MKTILYVVTVALALDWIAAPLRAEDLTQKIEQMERELQDLKHELQQQKAVQEKAQAEQAAKERAVAEPAAQPPPASSGVTLRDLTDRIKIGGYGSLRFEHSNLDELKNTFTLRRLVMTTDANIAPRLRFYAELEFEHFRKLELETHQGISSGGFTARNAIEGTSDSEISLEQAWLQFDLRDWLRFRAGAILVPVGRFNINHDDNRWDLLRRSLVDRGAPVLPSTAAWDELGAGFNGDIPFSDTVLGNYQLYVMNGVTLNSSIETLANARTGDTTLIAQDVELKPSAGTFNLDSKDAKAVSGRFALSPSLASEIAGSFYWGRYTPDFLPGEDLYAVSGDGRYTLGPFELEGEYVFTHFGGIDRVARRFAELAITKETHIETTTVEHEVDFELSQLATDKQGYWVDLRYRFWPQCLNQTVFGSPFAHPQLSATVRGEQAWFGDLVHTVDFENGTLTKFDKENRHLDRATLGFAYRPVPLVVFQLAYEYTWTDHGKSLAEVTNFLPAGSTENYAHGILVGTAFGF